jgi:acetylglutamate kinase
VKEIMVVKLGGSLLDEKQQRSRAISAIADRARAGSGIVIVHGGGRNIDAALTRAGIEKESVHGLRVTDARTLEVVTSVLAGTVNKSIVAELGASGIAAAGVSGVDGGILQADIHPPLDGRHLGFVGAVRTSEPALVLALLGAGFVPVIASLAAGPEGTILNVNADTAASAVAVALGATRVVFLTDVEGLLGDDGRLVTELDERQALAMLQSVAVSGGMKPKLRACVAALAGGVREVVIAGPSRHTVAVAGGEGGTCVVAA